MSRAETLFNLIERHPQTGRGLGFDPQGDDQARLTPQERELDALVSIADDIHALRRWFFGKYTLESQVDRTTRTLLPGQALKMAEVTNLEFGGAVLFASVGMTSKNVDISIIIDGQNHLFPGSSLVDGSFTAPVSPSLVVVRDMPTEAPQVVIVTNFGAPEGFPVFDSIVVNLINRDTGDVTIIETFFRLKRFWK